jgi:hypothetical protein
VIKRQWVDPRFWAWSWRYRASSDTKLKVVLLAAMIAISAVLVGTGNEDGAVAHERAVTRPLEPDARLAVEMFGDLDRTLRSESLLYDRWRRLNPVEAAAYEEYADEVARQAFSAPAPSLRTPFGRALVAAARLALTAPEPAR